MLKRKHEDKAATATATPPPGASLEERVAALEAWRRDRGKGLEVPQFPPATPEKQEACVEAAAVVELAKKALAAIERRVFDEARARHGTRWGPVLIDRAASEPLLEPRTVYSMASGFRYKVQRLALARRVRSDPRPLPSPPADLVRRLEAVELVAGIRGAS